MYQIVITYRNKDKEFIAELSKPDYKCNSEILFRHYTTNPNDIINVLFEYLKEEQPIPEGTYCIKSILLVDNSDFEKSLFSQNLKLYVHWDCQNLEKITDTKDNEQCQDVGDKFGFLYPFGF